MIDGAIGWMLSEPLIYLILLIALIVLDLRDWWEVAFFRIGREC